MEVMSGVKSQIIKRVPQSWEHVLRKHRAVTKFVDYTYDHCVPPHLRNGLKYLDGVANIRIAVRRGIFYCFDWRNTKEGFSFWYRIEQEIKQYEEQCR